MVLSDSLEPPMAFAKQVKNIYILILAAFVIINHTRNFCLSIISGEGLFPFLLLRINSTYIILKPLLFHLQKTCILYPHVFNCTEFT
jgi:hypothetical protein